MKTHMKTQKPLNAITKTQTVKSTTYSDATADCDTFDYLETTILLKKQLRCYGLYFRYVLPIKHFFLNENSVFKQIKHFHVHLTTNSLKIIKSQIFAVFVIFFFF